MIRKFQNIVSLLYSIICKIRRIQGNNNSLVGIHRKNIGFIRGDKNQVINQGYLGGTKLYIYGSNNTITIEDGVVFKDGKIWIEDNNNTISIGPKTTIEEAEIAVAENGRKIEIGEDCMFSSGIRITTTDSHSLINTTTKKRINPAADVCIGNHVWLGNGVNINKGVSIGNNAVVGAKSLVTHDVESHSLVAGTPARTIYQEIDWDRRRL